jgi:hypothetical protein
MARLTSLALCCTALLCAACTQESIRPIEIEPCDATSPDAGVSAVGTYDYESPIWNLWGTITFAQDGNTVSVTEVTYNHPQARSLVGSADLEGNRLDITLVPANGDTDYSADVTLIFEDGGQRFCLLEFSDSNDDYGGEGSYRGRLQRDD